MALQLEVGKLYWTRDGSVRGPLIRSGSEAYPFIDEEGYSYTTKGQFTRGGETPDDLIEEVTHFRLLQTSNLVGRTVRKVYRLTGLSTNEGLPIVSFVDDYRENAWAWLTDIEWCRQEPRVGDTVMCTQTNDAGALVLQGEYQVLDYEPSDESVKVRDLKGDFFWMWRDGDPEAPQYELLLSRRRRPQPQSKDAPVAPAPVTPKVGDKITIHPEDLPPDMKTSGFKDTTRGKEYEIISVERVQAPPYVRFIDDVGDSVGTRYGYRLVGSSIEYDEIVDEVFGVSPEEKERRAREAELLKKYKHERTVELLRDVMFSNDMDRVSPEIKEKIEAIFDRLIHDQEFESKRKDYDNARAVYTQHLNQANTLQEKKRELTVDVEVLQSRKVRFEQEIIELQTRIDFMRDALPKEVTTNGRKIQL
ncbi:hypothetical protein J2J97_32360 (plasmid) [Rhizobium bangladeshense]|uniref:hypothetical protein n=1 Tax=Rhizobium bangladeshense TaxID=1138189 RepID=UPI001A98F391|nr:hypothetical protein [Rhizobium bangladeshense]QSY98599.1 hypothetical protein J2J97_32360 [Rhizobium bangladeshense]